MLLSVEVLATDFTVTNLAANGAGSLNQAIADAQNTGAGPHRILFNLDPGLAGADGKYVISLSNGFNMYANKEILIDATSQPGYTCEPLIVLRGNGGGECFNGTPNAGAIYNIQGFIIQNWNRGFNFGGQTKGSIKTCWIGLNNDGTGAYPNPINQNGILLRGGVSDFEIGGPGCEKNVVSNTIKFGTDPGPEEGAIHISGIGANGSTVIIENNFIGTDKTGLVSIMNGANFPLRETGVLVNGTNGLTISNNIISSTSGNGIWNIGSNNTVIIGNKIGTDSLATSPMGNGGAGIRADNSSGLVIGGSSATERNIISANGGAPDSRNCGARQWEGGGLVDGDGVTCAQGPCESGCPDKYDATLHCGIYFKGVGSSQISGNYIGTDGTGNSTGTDNNLGNLYAGIKFEDASSGNTIGGSTNAFRNVIGGNGFDSEPDRVTLGFEYKGHGIQLNKASVQNTTISNNFIGIGADGNSPIGNRQDGISLLGSSRNTITQNVISDNTFGVFLQSDFQNGASSGQPSNNTISGNFIGTTADGLSPLGNGVRDDARVTDDDGAGIGIQHGSNNNTIGGTTVAARNIIAGNRNGILLRYPNDGNSLNAPTANTILGNYIGVDISGETKMANTFTGILLSQESFNNTIGGTTSAARNIIAGNDGPGITIENGDANKIFGNFIGQTASEVAMPNDGDGIRILSQAGGDADAGSVGNIIGGPLAGQGNVIVNNTGNGINILDAASNENSITRNSIACNDLRGIELNGVGNDNFAAPQIHSNSTDDQLNGSAPANSYVEIFAKDACSAACFPGNDQMEGFTYIGFAIADASGFWTFDQPTPEDYTLFTATASEITSAPTAATSYNTSEFSTCIQVCSPVASLTLDAPTYEVCSVLGIPEFTATATGGEPRPFTFNWYLIDGADSSIVFADVKTDVTDTVSTFTPNAAGTYSVTVIGTDIPDCPASSVSRTLIINEIPTFSVSSSSSDICFGESVDLEVSITNAMAGDYTFDWSASPAGQPVPADSVGTVSPTDTTEYTVIVTSPQGCKDTSDVLTINVNPLPDPTITLDGPAEFCEIVDSTLLIAVEDADYSYQWKNGSANIAAPEGLNDSLIVNESGSYTVVVTNTVTGCMDSTAASTVIIVNPSPVLTLDPNGSLNSCIGSEIPLEATGTGDFAWFVDDIVDVDSVGTTYVARVNGEYKVELTDANGCSSADSVVVTFSNDPVAFIGADATEFCEDDSVLISVTTEFAIADSIKWYLNDVLIPGAEGSLTYYATEAGDYKAFVATTAGCRDTSAAVTLDLFANPVITDLSASTTELCADDTVIISSTITDGLGPFEYIWTPVSVASDQTNFEDVPADTTTYSLVINDANGCSSDTSDVTVNVKERPVVDPVSLSPAGICFGDSTTLEANHSGGSGSGYIYEWAPSASLSATDIFNPIAKPTDTTTYSLVVTDGSGCSSDTGFVTVNVWEKPIVSAISAPDSICFEEDFDLSATVDPAGGSFDYLWLGNGLSATDVANPNATPDTDGDLIYELVVTDPNGCSSDTATKTVRVNEKPETPGIGNDTTVCFGDTAKIQITFLPAGVFGYEWFKDGADWPPAAGETDFPRFTDESGNYTLVIDHTTTGCKSDTSDAVIIEVLPEPGDLTVSGGGIFCDYGTDRVLTANVDDNGISYSVNWFKNGGTASVHTGDRLILTEAADSGSYLAEVTYEFPGGITCPYEALDSVEVGFRPVPVVFANSYPDGVICSGTEFKLQSRILRTTFDSFDTYPAHEDFYLFEWFGGIEPDTLEKADTISVEADYDFYTLVVTDLRYPENCATSDIVQLTDFINAGIEDDTLELCLWDRNDIRTYSNTDAYEYHWTFENNPLKYTSLAGTNLDSSSIGVRGVETVDDITFGQEYYYLTVGQCINIDSILVRVHPLPEVEITADLDTICVETPVTFTATADKGTWYKNPDRKARYDYYWKFLSDTTDIPYTYTYFNIFDKQDTTVVFEPHLIPEQMFVVEVQDSMGCWNEDTVFVHPKPNQDLVIPNLITPNGDDKNEVLVIKEDMTGQDLFEGATLEVYNRWGQAVYKNSNYDNTWGGEDCTEGTYFYILDTGCGDEEYKGWIRIINNTGTSSIFE